MRMLQFWGLETQTPKSSEIVESLEIEINETPFLGISNNQPAAKNENNINYFFTLASPEFSYLDVILLENIVAKRNRR